MAQSTTARAGMVVYLTVFVVAYATAQTSNSTDALCRSIICSDRCQGVCGWNSTVGGCRAGAFTHPSEAGLGDCSTLEPSTLPPTLMPSSGAPTVAPSTQVPTSLAPTVPQPTTATPTFAPTHSPTTRPTFAPTQLPTTATPTDAPTTLSPTISPSSASPTSFAPTIAPTTRAPTSATPTQAPTATPPLAAFECIESSRFGGGNLSNSELIAVRLNGSYSCEQQVAALNGLLSQCPLPVGTVRCGQVSRIPGYALLDGACTLTGVVATKVNGMLSQYAINTPSGLAPYAGDQVRCGIASDFFETASGHCSVTVAALNGAVNSYALGSRRFANCEFLTTTATTQTTQTATTTTTALSQGLFGCISASLQGPGATSSVIGIDSAVRCERQVFLLNRLLSACHQAHNGVFIPLTCERLPRLQQFSVVNASCASSTGTVALINTMLTAYARREGFSGTVGQMGCDATNDFIQHSITGCDGTVSALNSAIDTFIMSDSPFETCAFTTIAPTAPPTATPTMGPTPSQAPTTVSPTRSPTAIPSHSPTSSPTFGCNGVRDVDDCNTAFSVEPFPSCSDPLNFGGVMGDFCPGHCPSYCPATLGPSSAAPTLPGAPTTTAPTSSSPTLPPSSASPVVAAPSTMAPTVPSCSGIVDSSNCDAQALAGLLTCSTSLQRNQCPAHCNACTSPPTAQPTMLPTTVTTATTTTVSTTTTTTVTSITTTSTMTSTSTASTTTRTPLAPRFECVYVSHGGSTSEPRVISATTHGPTCSWLVGILNNLMEACTGSEVPLFRCDNVSHALLQNTSQVAPGTLLLDGGCTNSGAGTALNSMLHRFDASAQQNQISCGLTISPLVQVLAGGCSATVAVLNRAVQAFYEGSFSTCTATSTTTTRTTSTTTMTSVTSTVTTVTDTTATTRPPCQDISADGLPWHLDVSVNNNCTFFEVTGLCDVPNAAEASGSGGFSANDACCACGGGTTRDSYVQIVSAPINVAVSLGGATHMFIWVNYVVAQTRHGGSSPTPSSVAMSVSLTRSDNQATAVQEIATSAVINSTLGSLSRLPSAGLVYVRVSLLGHTSIQSGNYSLTVYVKGLVNNTATPGVNATGAGALVNATTQSDEFGVAVSVPLTVAPTAAPTSPTAAPTISPLPPGPGVVIVHDPSPSYPIISGQQTRFNLSVVYRTACGSSCLTRVVVTVSNPAYPGQGFVFRVVVADTGAIPSGLSSEGRVALTVAMGSWAPASSAYRLQAHVVEINASWSTRLTSLNTMNFSLTNSSTTTASSSVSACHDIHIGRTPWHDGVNAVYNCTFFAGPLELCGADEGAPGLGGMVSNEACCGCGGGLSGGNTISITSAPAVVQKDVYGRSEFNMTVRYGTASMVAGATYRVVLVVVNPTDLTHNGYVMSVSLTGVGGDPRSLPPASIVALTVRLGTWAPLGGGYTLKAVLIGNEGSWADRLAESPTVPFSVAPFSAAPLVVSPSIELQQVPTSVAKAAGQRATLSLVVSYSGGTEFTGPVRIVVVIRNDNDTLYQGYVVGTTLTGNASATPTNLPSNGSVALDVQIGSWAPVSPACASGNLCDPPFRVFAALLSADGSWADRIATSNTSRFAIVSANPGAAFGSLADGHTGQEDDGADDVTTSDADGVSNSGTDQSSGTNHSLIVALAAVAMVAVLVATTLAVVSHRRAAAQARPQALTQTTPVVTEGPPTVISDIFV